MECLRYHGYQEGPKEEYEQRKKDLEDVFAVLERRGLLLPVENTAEAEEERLGATFQLEELDRVPRVTKT